MEKWKKFSLIEKLQLRTNKYHNSSVKLWILRKYAIELISKESYKKGLLLLVLKTLKDITNHSLKLAKVFSQ